MHRIGSRGDELVRRVVLVGGDEECAAEAGAGLADDAAEGIFIRTTPARRIKACGAFVGLGPVRAVFVGGLHDAVQQRFLGAPVGVGYGRCLRFRAVAAAGLLSLLSYRHAQRHIHRGPIFPAFVSSPRISSMTFVQGKSCSLA